MAQHSAEGRRVRRDLDKMLEQVSQMGGRQETFDVTETARISLLIDLIDRKCELQQLYREADDAALKLKIATEVRLAEGQAARLLKELQPKLPAASRSSGSNRATQRARRAANL